MSELFSTSTVGQVINTRLTNLETSMSSKLPLGGGTLTGGLTTPSLTVSGAAGFAGASFTGTVTFGDSGFSMAINAGNSQITFDLGGDTFTYNRATNTYAFAIGGALAFSIGPGNIMIPLSQLTTYADNAAATTGGLGVGGLYRTATGQLMVRY